MNTLARSPIHFFLFLVDAARAAVPEEITVYIRVT